MTTVQLGSHCSKLENDVPREEHDEGVSVPPQGSIVRSIGIRASRGHEERHGVVRSGLHDGRLCAGCRPPKSGRKCMSDEKNVLKASCSSSGLGIGVGAGIHTDGVDITWMEKECAPLTEALWFFGRRAYNILASLAVPVWGGLGQPVGQPRGICNSHTCTPSQEGPQANRTLWR